MHVRGPSTAPVMQNPVANQETNAEFVEYLTLVANKQQPEGKWG